jgi:hypothetical protein
MAPGTDVCRRDLNNPQTAVWGIVECLDVAVFKKNLNRLHTAVWRIFGFSSQNTNVWIDRAGLFTSAAFPSTHKKYVALFSLGFITTTATRPSGF